MTLTRSLVILAVLGIPLAAGGAYFLSNRSDAPKGKPAPCCCCCDAPSPEELIASISQGETKSDCPMYGGTPQRNMVNLVDKNVPTDWSLEEGQFKNVKWVATLGDKAYGGPIVANGRVYVGTNNGNHREQAKQRSVLMAFNEADGKLLWKIEHPALTAAAFRDGSGEGLCSTPIIEGDAIYYVTPSCQVVRASVEGKVVWNYDMMKELQVVPFHLGNCSPVIVGDLVMVITGNGVDATTGAVASPKAPSFIAVHKQTGKLVWQSALPGDKIIEGQWTNPCVAVVDGKPQAIFPGGDGVIYSLEPETGALIWKFDCHPVRPKVEPGEKEALNYFIATPVIHDNKLYIGMGKGPELGHTNKASYVFCIDVTKKGDVSPKSLDAADPANKASALVWAYGGEIVPRPKRGRSSRFAHTISTCAVHEGLVYAAEEAGLLHCLDAKTGQPYWIEDMKAATWSSPYYVDGKIYLANEDRQIAILAHGKTKKLIANAEVGEPMHTTPIVANGTLYVMTAQRVYAIAEKK